MIELDVIRKLAFTDPVPFEVFEIYGFPNGKPKGQYKFNSFKETYKDTVLPLDEWQSLFDIWYEKNALIPMGEFSVRKNKILSHGFASQYSNEKLTLQEWCELWDTYMESLNVYDFKME